MMKKRLNEYIAEHSLSKNQMTFISINEKGILLGKRSFWLMSEGKIIEIKLDRPRRCSLDSTVQLCFCSAAEKMQYLE